MSEHTPEPEPTDPSLSELEANLGGIAPTLAHFNRDAVLYHSGHRTAERNYRRAVRRWQGVCGVLVSLMFVQTVWVWQLSGEPATPPVSPAPQLSPTETQSGTSVELIVEDANNSPTTTPPTEKRAPWFVLAPGVNRSQRGSLRPGLRSGSAVIDLDSEPGFTPRTSLADDGSPTTPFPFTNPRMVQ